MKYHQVVIIHLRRPKHNDPDETRADPFWEFGSFGCTGCHGRNIMNPNRIGYLQGVRIAFAQGGQHGFRLVMVTPPVTVIRHRNRCELKWKPIRMPFRYDAAPLIIDAEGSSDFPRLRQMFYAVNRNTWPQRFSSKFRTRKMPLPEDVGKELCSIFDRRYGGPSSAAIAKNYEDALPYAPNKIDRKREKSYMRAIKKAKRTRVKCGA